MTKGVWTVSIGSSVEDIRGEAEVEVGIETSW